MIVYLRLLWFGFVCLCDGARRLCRRARRRMVSGPIYNVVHFDVIPATIGGVDFLQNGYALLFKYRDQSNADAGLIASLLNLIPPTTNHLRSSESSRLQVQGSPGAIPYGGVPVQRAE